MLYLFLTYEQKERKQNFQVIREEPQKHLIQEFYHKINDDIPLCSPFLVQEAHPRVWEFHVLQFPVSLWLFLIKDF